MEGFPLDVQRLLLSAVAEGRVYRLRHLFCVNRLWRKRVSRYLLDTTNKEWFANEAPITKTAKHYYAGWNIFDALSHQWTSALRSAFIMYLSAEQLANLVQERFRINYPRANKLFYTKHSILRDIRKKKSTSRLLKRRSGRWGKREILLKRPREKWSDTSSSWKKIARKETQPRRWFRNWTQNGCKQTKKDVNKGSYI